jgi:preprotein translocase subunit SecE
VARNDRRREKNRRQARREQEQLEGEQPQTPAPGDEQPRNEREHHDLMEDAEGAPNPLEHATPDAELAAAQMALGRPEFAETPDESELEGFEEEQFDEDQDDAPAAGALATRGGGGGRGGRRRGTATGGEGGGHGGSVAVPDHKVSMPARLVGFLRGSWNELQRTQWPDRRQVAQATGVVLGFVIVAGAFLGAADLVASKLVNLLIK